MIALSSSKSREHVMGVACWADNAADMKAKREETVKYFLEQYKTMPEENLDDYIEHYANYMKANG